MTLWLEIQCLSNEGGHVLLLTRSSLFVSYFIVYAGLYALGQGSPNFETRAILDF